MNSTKQIRDWTKITYLAVSHFNHYTRMFSVLVWSCNWILLMHRWSCPIHLIHLIEQKSLHFEKPRLQCQLKWKNSIEPEGVVGQEYVWDNGWEGGGGSFPLGLHQGLSWCHFLPLFHQRFREVRPSGEHNTLIDDPLRNRPPPGTKTILGKLDFLR